jgi:hypothetical protein
MWTVKALLLFTYTKQNCASKWLLIKSTALVWKACREFSYKINRITAAISIYWKEDVLFQLKIRGASEILNNQLRHLLRPTSVNFRQHCRNLSHKTVPLNKVFLGYLFIILMLMIGIVMGDKAIFTVSIDYITNIQFFTHLTKIFLWCGGDCKTLSKNLLQIGK